MVNNELRKLQILNGLITQTLEVLERHPTNGFHGVGVGVGPTNFFGGVEQLGAYGQPVTGFSFPYINQNQVSGQGFGTGFGQGYGAFGYGTPSYGMPTYGTPGYGGYTASGTYATQPGMPFRPVW